MFGDPFYYSTIRKIVIGFGSLFDNLYVVRTQDNNPIKIKIPILYSSKEKFIQRYKDTLNRENNDSIVLQTILPKLGFDIGEITYDASRKKPSINKRFIESQTSETKLLYTEVPYNVNFTMTAYVRYIDDGLQIAEQILPYFTPDFTIAIKQNVLGEEGERMNVPIVLNSVSQNVDYEGALDINPRIILWDYSFTARINLFAPQTEIPLITLSENNIQDIQALEE
jgi:hypothetical protein